MITGVHIHVEDGLLYIFSTFYLVHDMWKAKVHIYVGSCGTKCVCPFLCCFSIFFCLRWKIKVWNIVLVDYGYIIDLFRFRKLQFHKQKENRFTLGFFTQISFSCWCALLDYFFSDMTLVKKSIFVLFCFMLVSSKWKTLKNIFFLFFYYFFLRLCVARHFLKEV